MRPLTDMEREVLRLLVSVPFDGVEELRAQVESIDEVESNCTCGCPSFTPLIDRSSVSPAPFRSLLPSELVERERAGGIPRTVNWFADAEGYVSNVECVYYDDAQHEWPDPEGCDVLAGRMGR